MSPKVSIVIPAYNNVQYIDETLRSVLNQTYQDVEVIVADHSSLDDTARVIATFASHPKVRILTPTPRGGGAQANWNRVSQAAAGKYIKLVCGDDVLYPTAVAEQVAALDSHPNNVLTASQRDLVDANGKIFLRGRGLQGLYRTTSGPAAIRASVRRGANILGEPASVMFRRDVLEAEGWWDNSYPYLIDQATYARICSHGDVVPIRKSLATFRISASQWSVRLARQQSDQAIAFHRAMAREFPTLISKTDLLIGNANAVGMAFARRLAYMRLSHRMGKDRVVESTT